MSINLKDHVLAENYQHIFCFVFSYSALHESVYGKTLKSALLEISVVPQKISHNITLIAE